MTRGEAFLAFMRAVLRAQDTRHMLTWSNRDMREAYIIATIPGCTLDEFCTHAGYEVEEAPVPDEPEEIDNDAALGQLQAMQAQGAPLKVGEQPKPEPPKPGAPK
jgi:hypothetical protein